MHTSIQQALEQVQELRSRILENQLFRGYSGEARLLGAVAALVGTLLLSSPFVPRTVFAHSAGWGVVCASALLINYAALFRWYFQQSTNQRELTTLRPAVDALPSLFVGGLLTAMLFQVGMHDLLFGVWMLMFGLMHTSSRHSMPQRMWWLGLFYLGCGTWYCVCVEKDFLNPWPMGLVFTVGELMGSVILRDHRLKASF